MRHLIIVVGFLAAACVAPPEVPKVDPRDDDEDLLVHAVYETFAVEGLGVDSVSENGRRIESTWVGNDDQRRRFTVRISRTSMGLALAIRAHTIVPAGERPDGETGSDQPYILIDGASWRAEPAVRAAEKHDEARLGRAIQERWQAKLRTAREQELRRQQ